MKNLILMAAAAAVLAGAGAAQAAQGLNGRYYNANLGNNSANETYADANTPFATFLAHDVCFPDCSYTNSISDGAMLSQFLGVSGSHSSDLSQDQNGVGAHILVLDGFLHIATAGTYNFALSSDDGSFLRIDGINVINNDGLHAPNDVRADATLSAGVHSLRILQWENGGGTNLQVLLRPPLSGDYQAAGGDYLSTSAAPEPAAWALMILGFGGVGATIRRRRTAASAA